ncbi:hypothetical protein GF326_02025 [Candidatus Bathyarchaeota archaeon]|nr:hypothetical protein [Candidatus Bathyarchaeota archaeon]
MLDLRYVDLYAHGAGVSREVAERDIVLTYILKIMKEDSILENLAFKGGTCIRKIYLGNLGRFSEDLDFTLIGYDLNSFEYKFRNFIKYSNNYGFTFEEKNVRKEWGKSFACDLDYSHEWFQSSFKFEVSLREDPIIPLEEKFIKDEIYFKYTDFEPFSVPCMCLEEVLSEKIRATYQRGTARDYFDLYQFARRPYDRELVKQLVVIKFWNDRSDYDPHLFFDKVKREKIDFSDVQYLLKDREHPEEGEIKTQILDNYDYLSELDTSLDEIRNDNRKHRKEHDVKQLIRKLR